jgi:hypothetical protein
LPIGAATTRYNAVADQICERTRYVDEPVGRRHDRHKEVGLAELPFQSDLFEGNHVSAQAGSISVWDSAGG